MNLPRKNSHKAKLFQYPGPVGHSAQHPQEAAVADPWPEIPVNSDTRILVEMILGTPTIDLESLCEILLSDLGATVQVLRCTAKHIEDSKLRPLRLHECLVSLGKVNIQNSCAQVLPGLETASAESFSELWRHSWMVSRFAYSIAQVVDGGEPEKARIAGLLHDLGRIPSCLGWTNSAWPQSSEDLGCKLADQWGLPWYVIFGIRCYDRPDTSAAMISRLVAAAHDCERIYTDGIYNAEPERYEPYWLAVLERAFPDLPMVEQQHVMQEFISAVKQLPFVESGCIIR